MPDRRQVALQVRIGAFILAGLVVFLAIIYLLGAQTRYFERKYNLIAEFEQVGGLLEGATVRLAGVQIGRVTDIALSPEPGGKVQVTLTIARRFADRIRKDSEARIVTQGLLGDRLVEITMGSPQAPPLQLGEKIAAREPFEPGRVFAEAAETLASIRQFALGLGSAVERIEKSGTFDNLAKLGASLSGVADRFGRSGALDDLGAAARSAREITDRLGRSGALDDLGAAAKSARRITEEIEQGRGLLHALVYEEPETLRRLNALLASTQQLMARAESGDNAISTLLSPQSGKATRSFLAAMDTLGRGAEKPGAGDGLLPALLFDPEYKMVAEDLQVVARNFRDVSQKLANGEGLLGGLLQGDGVGDFGSAGEDFRIAMANLRAVTDRLKAGDGTIGALIEDPTVYENLVQFLEGSRRSFLLRRLIRSTIGTGAASESSERPAPRAR